MAQTYAKVCHFVEGSRGTATPAMCGVQTYGRVMDPRTYAPLMDRTTKLEFTTCVKCLDKLVAAALEQKAKCMH